MSGFNEEPAPVGEVPPYIPEEMRELYRKEVEALLKELRIFSQASLEKGVLAGDTLLQGAMQRRDERQPVCEILSWMVDELQGVLAMQTDTLQSIPEYTKQAIHELLDKCRDKLSQTHRQTIEEITRQIAQRRKQGYYQAEAELMMLNHDITVLLGETLAGGDRETIAHQLELEDYARHMAHLDPNVQKELEHLGRIKSISLPHNLGALLESLTGGTTLH